jgi:protein-S-isoprenylcysteine O-methyltransferase Ste14
MSILNPAAATTQLPAPLFELTGRAAKVDLSAWISAAVLALGISRVGPSVVAQDYAFGGFGLHMMIASYVAFIAIVVLLQMSMRIAPVAHSFGTARALTTSGAFSFTRNPIYLAFFLPLSALAYFDTMTAVASAVIYVTLMNLTVIRKEERHLQQTFGDDYTAYRNAVPRWIA